jgi:HPt (histidine-containing phosphotransfer) domain-containing protein
VRHNAGSMVQDTERSTDVRDMESQETAPIFSTCEDDPSKGEAIHQFVIGLAEQVDTLQDAELEGDDDGLAKLADTLGKTASDLGYEPLAQISQVVATACREGKIEDAQAAMVELTLISSRVRRGHRGSA